MSTGFYLQDNPNVNWPQYGWERAKVGQPGQQLSGVMGVHTTENITDFAGPDYNAEDVAKFISQRDSWGGYHVVSDYDSIVLLVHPKYAAWADTTNNAHALSVSGSLQAARWLEMTPERRRQVVTNMGKAAAQIVLIAVRDGYLAAPIPARRISAAQAIAGTAQGFYGHGETNPGTRYDPGANFDWGLFLASYAAAVGGGALTSQSSTTTADKENDVKAYKRITVAKRTALGNKTEWWLKNSGGKVNQDFSDGLPVGNYDVDLYVEGTGLKDGEHLDVRFDIVTKGKRSGHFTQRVQGSTDGTYCQPVRFKMPLDDGQLLEASVKASSAGVVLTRFAADVYVLS
ncbi:endolysin [Arthrobacter phage Shambre1]|uniref:Endolysin n=1 Tax=Arthrobacter phage Shambre1 TaxID=2927284 RepID=A0A977KNK5_9CAUD|nr:endolysin [Arthrobacter phage Shambre1]UXE04763.1 endolysin [Arthrobacter phage Shambre1]